MFDTKNYQEVVKLLKETFPLTNPLLTDSIETVQRKAGQQDLIIFLESSITDAQGI